MGGIEIALVFVLPIMVIMFIIAKIMVKKRIGLAKCCIIGKDSPEKIEELKKMAQSILTNGTVSMSKEDAETLSIQFIQRKNETSVTIESDKTSITCSSEAPEPLVKNIGFSEHEATFSVFIDLVAISAFVVAVIGLILILRSHLSL